MPFYLHYMGAEAFGLVGFYIMIQAWMQLLDMGLTPVLSRSMSCLRAEKLGVSEALARLRVLEWILGSIAILSVSLIWMTSDWIGQQWLSAPEIDHNTLNRSIALIGLAAALRWLTGIYKGSLVGLEKQSWVNGISAVFTTLRFAGVIPLLVFFSTAPDYFFAFQATVTMLELLMFSVLVRRLLPHTHLSWKPDFRVFVAMLPMVGSMAFLSAMWIVVTQIDKLVLSSILPLKEYGYYTLAIMAANGVLMPVPPLSQVIQPRMTVLAEQANEERLVELYRLTSQLAAIVFFGMGGGIAFFAEPLLRIWSGNDEIARAAAPILFWYGLANAFVGVLVLPFMLQFAKGRLRLHIIGTLIRLFTLVPALVFCAIRWGAVGAGQVFFFANLLFFLLWVPFMHHRFLSKVAWRWPFVDTMPICLGILAWLALASQTLPESTAPLVMLIWIGVSVVIAAGLGITLGTRSRRYALEWILTRIK